MKQRIEYFDILKGIAIFLVVMGHVITMCIREIDAAFIFKLIGQVHMPIFFFISGFLSYREKNGITYAPPAIKKRFMQLIVPFIVMSALWIWYFPHSSLSSPISDSLIGMYCSFWKDGYWFTLCLFEMFLLYIPLSAILRRCNKLWEQFVVSLIAYSILLIAAFLWSSEQENFDIAGLGLLSWFFPIFMMGVFAKKYSVTYQAITSNGSWFTVAAVVFALTFYAIAYPWNLPFLPDWTKALTRPLMHISIVLIAVAAIRPSNRHESFPAGTNQVDTTNKQSAVIRFFKYLGTESLSIYLLHYFFLFPLTPLREPLRAIGLPFVPLAAISVAVALLIIAVTLFVSHIISRSPILSILMLGKSCKQPQ